MSDLDDMFQLALDCPRHGTQMWKGHCSCRECGRIFENATTDWTIGGIQVRDGKQLVTPPGVIHDACPCGSTNFGRICKRCFVRLDRKGERAPVQKAAN